MASISDTFERSSIVAIVEIGNLAERMRGAGRTTTTTTELAERLGQPVGKFIHVIDLLGVTPTTWSSPEDFSLDALAEACFRHETGRRYNRALMRDPINKGV